MWLLGSGGDAVQKCKIEEANKHLAAMAQRIEELEKVVEDQRNELAAKDERAAQFVKVNFQIQVCCSCFNLGL